MSVSDRHFGLRKRDIDPKAKQVTLMLMTRLRLYDHVTTRDVLAELIELRGKLPNARLESGRGFHVAEGDLQWKYHVSCDPV